MKLRIRPEHDARQWHWRIFSQWDEIGYLVLRRWCSLGFEIEWPTTWHESRRVWVLASFLLGKFAVSFRWRGEVGDDYHQCSGPTYGFGFHEDNLTIEYGQARGIRDDPRWVWWYPWSWEHKRTCYLNSDGSIFRQERKGEYQTPGEILERYPYRHVRPNGEVQQCMATVHGELREWRWRWLMWLPWPRKVQRSIWCDFDREMGERVGSWKGGTIGCGYDWRRGETMRQALERMQIERVRL
jgi:hypothetical protein